MSRASALLITSKKEVLDSRTLKTPMTNSDKQGISIKEQRERKSVWEEVWS